MNKNWIRVQAAACVAFVMLFSAACSSKNNDNGGASSTDGSTNVSAKTADTAADPLAKKLKITAFEGLWGKVLPSDSPGVKAIDEKFNIDYKPEFVPMDQAQQKIAVLMASGSQPDILGLEGVDSNFIKWAKQGAFLPLNDYIDKYPQLQQIPKSIWDSVSVDGKIYGIPQYFHVKYMNSAVIRKDWLDKLGLPMPSNYDELLQVSKAFTEKDPDGNGKADTYGFSTSKGIDWNNRMGVYYDIGAWYHKNEQGQLIPGIISDDANLDRLKFMQDAYAAGTVPKDWPVMEYTDARQVFWSGKAGIYYEGIPGTGSMWNLLSENAPDAEVVPIPPFKAPDGSQGQPGMSGYYTMKTLSSKLANDPDKIDRILTMVNQFMTFTPFDQRNPQNENYDWKQGGVDKGYTYANGVADLSGDNDAKVAARPSTFFTVQEWAPSDEALELDKGLKNPKEAAYAKAVIEEWNKPNYVYIDPFSSIHSDVFNEKMGALYDKVMDGETKIILGQEPLSYFDTIKADFLKNGGQAIIDDVNKQIEAVGATGTWK
ncbi:extracellular solute-binding protein [Paenibacillus rhizovicinus]|uniref:Extracellular solute-binding protein n=1 Tax=Paenibacillus rhizovicinus TaxID=2704463 RepID=A0A6C0NZ17_9BACL|nr:extracellular solute-binding protein [Paenibacillus rhizovicinus]QHW31449.1 extracellular solute-binding protein [Paenibacillus rhizovicinus]